LSGARPTAADARASTEDVDLSRGFAAPGLATFQSRTVLSLPAVARVRPSGLKTRSCTSEVSSGGPTCVSLRRFQKRTAPPQAVASRCPVGRKARPIELRQDVDGGPTCVWVRTFQRCR